MARKTASLLSAAALALPGCVASAPPEPAPAPPESASDECGAERLDRYLNVLPTSEFLSRIRQTVGHDRIRVIAPGDAVTMDFRPDRLNIETGEDGRIRLFRCG